jgi:hypothetical protein
VITAERLRELLHYDPDTGVLTWLVSTGNRVRIGDAAGYARSDGYRGIKVGGQRFLVHRLAWLYVHGEFPSADIDHINGIPDDNRLANLRLATNSQNMGNRRKNANNRSGFKGVFSDRGKWRAQIKVSGCRHYLGLFDTPADAHAAYLRAAEKHFGQFARAE